MAPQQHRPGHGGSGGGGGGGGGGDDGRVREHVKGLEQENASLRALSRSLMKAHHRPRSTRTTRRARRLALPDTRAHYAGWRWRWWAAAAAEPAAVERCLLLKRSLLGSPPRRTEKRRDKPRSGARSRRSLVRCAQVFGCPLFWAGGAAGGLGVEKGLGSGAD